jgi:hypothetical protein
MGNYTTNQFLYKPTLGASGTLEKNNYDAGLDLVDSRLGKEVWVDDPLAGSTLASAITYCNNLGTNCTLVVPAGVYTISVNTVVVPEVSLRMMKGAIITVNTGITLTINGPFNCGPYKCFALAGTGVVAFGNSSLAEVYPQWWGATGDGITDDSVAIQAALKTVASSTGGTVRLPIGTYLTSTTTIRASGLFKLVGAGREKSIIKYTGTDCALWVNPGDTIASHGWSIADICLTGNSVGHIGIAIGNNSASPYSAGGSVERVTCKYFTVAGIDLRVSQISADFTKIG